jgi:hypothetical protein
MPTGADRIALLLAASGLTDRAIFDGLKELEALGAGASVRRIQKIRQKIASRGGNLLIEEYGVSQTNSDKERETVVSKVLQLLIDEARLTPPIAAERIREALSKGSRETPELPPFRPKDGLRAWLRRLADHIPSSELLHHASSIRNSAAHIAEPDWPLRNRE